MTTTTTPTQEALEFWASGANGHAAISYLRRRGINLASLPEPYRVGYARPGWTSLVDHLATGTTRPPR